MEVEEVCSSDIREISPRRPPVTEDARVSQATEIDINKSAANENVSYSMLMLEDCCGSAWKKFEKRNIIFGDTNL